MESLEGRPDKLDINKYEPPGNINPVSSDPEFLGVVQTVSLVRENSDKEWQRIWPGAKLCTPSAVLPGGVIVEIRAPVQSYME